MPFPPVLLSFLISLARTFRKMLNRSCDSGHLCLLLDLWLGGTFGILPWSKMFALGPSYTLKVSDTGVNSIVRLSPLKDVKGSLAFYCITGIAFSLNVWRNSLAKSSVWIVFIWWRFLAMNLFSFSVNFDRLWFPKRVSNSTTSPNTLK